MDKNSKILVLLSVFSLVLYPISDLLAVGVALTVLLCSCFILKSNETTIKTLQPALMLSSVYILRGVISLIMNVITNIANATDKYYSTSLYENVSKFNNIFSVICTLIIVVYLVITIVFFALKKDVPLFGSLAKKITGQEKKSCD